MGVKLHKHGPFGLILEVKMKRGELEARAVENNLLWTLGEMRLWHLSFSKRIVGVVGQIIKVMVNCYAYLEL